MGASVTHSKAWFFSSLDAGLVIVWSMLFTMAFVVGIAQSIAGPGARFMGQRPEMVVFMLLFIVSKIRLAIYFKFSLGILPLGFAPLWYLVHSVLQKSARSGGATQFVESYITASMVFVPIMLVLYAGISMNFRFCKCCKWCRRKSQQKTNRIKPSAPLEK